MVDIDAVRSSSSSSSSNDVVGWRVICSKVPVFSTVMHQ